MHAAICRSFVYPPCDRFAIPHALVYSANMNDHARSMHLRFRQERAAPRYSAGFSRQTGFRWLDGLIAEQGLSRNTVAASQARSGRAQDFPRRAGNAPQRPGRRKHHAVYRLAAQTRRRDPHARAAHFVPAQFPRMVRRTGGAGLQPGRPHRHAQAPLPPARRADAG